MTSHEHENQRPETVICEINRTSLFSEIAVVTRAGRRHTILMIAVSQAGEKGREGKRGRSEWKKEGLAFVWGSRLLITIQVVIRILMNKMLFWRT